MIDQFKIRVVSPWFGDLKLPQAYLSTTFAVEEAEALLCDWAPTDDLWTFSKRKAWYCCEPQCQFSGLGGGSWPRLRQCLQPHEFICHNHPDPRYRVPHVTHFEELSMDGNIDRLDRAIAIVSNHGGSPWRRHPHLRFRNRFITHPKVDLFGRAAWNTYRRHWFSRKAPPENYRGELPGDWPAQGKRSLMARYKVAVCLENMNEPYYFTEKFVEAVCSGCIPIYRADPTVSGGVLKGARWVDPADHGNDPERTLCAALQADSFAFRDANQQWLSSAVLAETHHVAVFRRLANILSAS